MFLVEDDEPQKPQADTSKIIYIFENGTVHDKPKEFKILKKNDNFKSIRQALGYHQLRLFNSEGAEYFGDDLDYIKTKSTLYASKGEDFDPLSTFAEYEMLRKIGEGGFGLVQLARHRLTGEEFAIKTIRVDKLKSATDIDSIFVEVEALKQMKHENIVRVFNCLTLRNMQVAIIMEYLEGGELLAYVEKEGQLKQQTALIIFRQIVNAMSYCHSNGLIHRDLKLENMLLVSREELKIKIIDFGIAGAMTSLTWEDLDIGSLAYMAPECFVVTKGYQIDGRIDVWALGVILFAMLTGELPFKGANNELTIEAIKEGKYRVPSKISKTLSEPCLEILSQCLRTDPKTRPTMEDLENHPWVRGITSFSTKKEVKVMDVVLEEQEDKNQSKANPPGKVSNPRPKVAPKTIKPISASKGNLLKKKP